MSLFIDYPWWFIVLCILGGLIYAGALYAKDRLNRHFPLSLIFILALLRFCAVSFIAFFLLNPLIRTVDRIVEKPIVVIAQDNSESIVMGVDSTYYRTDYLTSLQSIEKELSENYVVKSYRFGDKVDAGIESIAFEDKSTNFTNLLEELNETYSNRNLGAVIIASDGLYNQGNSPVYSYSSQFEAPVFTIALGDTTPKKDLLIAEIASNRLAYLGNKFPVEVLIEARKLKGNSSRLRVYKGNQVQFEKSISINDDFYQELVPFTLDAKSSGLQRFRISLSPIDGEITVANNTRDIFIDILDSRQKILVMYPHPHPDIAAIRKSIESNENYQVEVVQANKFIGDLDDFSMIFFHQIPSSSGNSKWAKAALDKKIPSMFILGTASDIGAFNSLNTGVKIQNVSGNLSDAYPNWQEGFTSFKLGSELKSTLRKLPPLNAPIADLDFSPGLNVMLKQRIGLIDTDQPLLAFNEVNGRKTGILIGEGLWRWRMVSFLENQDHDVFNELLIKTVQFLASKEDKSQFRVSGPENLLETERVKFSAEVYNESYEPLEDKEVNVSIVDDSNNQFPFTFSSAGSSYSLDAGLFPVGNYTYNASVVIDGKTFRESGEFAVQDVQLELARSTADHSILNQWSEKSGGKMLYPSQINTLAQLIIGSNDLVSTSYEQKSLTDLINKKWILFLLLALLSLEWLLRKRNGTY